MDTENPKTAIEYIHSLGRFSGKPGLHRIKALCEALGNPQDRLKFVHLAGTNGKGSTACMIASALQAAGLRTGLYTSPYLVQFYERIRVDGVMISDDDLTRLCERVTVACESLTLPEGETIGEQHTAGTKQRVAPKVARKSDEIMQQRTRVRGTAMLQMQPHILRRAAVRPQEPAPPMQNPLQTGMSNRGLPCSQVSACACPCSLFPQCAAR